jgi:hypothetical protein
MNLPAPLCDLCASAFQFQLFSFSVFSVYPFMLLTYLDRMKPGHAFRGTTNLDVASLTESFQARFCEHAVRPVDRAS